MSDDKTKAESVLRDTAKYKHTELTVWAYVILVLASVLAYIGFSDGMPLWQAGIACSVLTSLALWLWLRGRGLLGIDLRLEFETLIADSSQVIGYSNTKTGNGNDEIDIQDGITSGTGGDPTWQTRLYLADERILCISLIEPKKRRVMKAIKTLFPHAKRRRYTKKSR